MGTLSAAYPALTVVLARLFLGEHLLTAQYVGVGAVIAGCLALAYTPRDDTKHPQRRWMAHDRSTPLSGAYPVVTVGFAYALLHERPNVLQWAGIVLVLAGMVVTTASG